jgi:dethiobiotin synthetase
MTALFVSGAHTDVGKTYASCGLLRAGRTQGLTVDALKPVVSGFDFADWAETDPGRLIAALGRAHTRAVLDAMSPWIFQAALAPPMAATLEGRSLATAELAAFCTKARTDADLFLIEGAGGVMSPLTSDGTCLDLMKALGLPTLLVGGSYLGGISHTLTAVETLKAHGVPITAIAVSEAADPDAPDFDQTVALVARYAGGVPVVAVARNADDGWAGKLLTDLGVGAG